MSARANMTKGRLGHRHYCKPPKATEDMWRDEVIWECGFCGTYWRIESHTIWGGWFHCRIVETEYKWGEFDGAVDWR